MSKAFAQRLAFSACAALAIALPVAFSGYALAFGATDVDSVQTAPNGVINGITNYVSYETVLLADEANIMRESTIEQASDSNLADNGLFTSDAIAQAAQAQSETDVKAEAQAAPLAGSPMEMVDANAESEAVDASAEVAAEAAEAEEAAEATSASTDSIADVIKAVTSAVSAVSDPSDDRDIAVANAASDTFEHPRTITVEGVTIPYKISYMTSTAPSSGAGLWLGDDDTADGTWGYFIGHNPGDFTPVMDLTSGDEVTVCDSKGLEQSYSVVDVFTVPDSTYFEDIESRVTHWGESVVLQTCSGDNATYRIVVAVAQ